MMLPKKWKIYELFVARLMSDGIPTSLTVTPNARIKGTITGIQRQIDVLIDCRHDTDNSRRVIVDAKTRKRKIDVTHVEAFEGLMRDVEAHHGLLVCPSGHTEAAKKRAQQSIGIHLVPESYLDRFDPTQWDRCCSMACMEGRVFWDGYPEVGLELMPASDPSEDAGKVIRYVHAVGKCERCRCFHLKCFSCSELVAMGDEDNYRCKCQPPWFWLTSIEDDGKGTESAELHAVTFTGEVTTFDRRSM